MVWKINYTKKANDDLAELDRPIKKRISDFLEDRIANLDDPRNMGKVLSGKLGDYWRYQLGDYRIICDIQDKEITILVIKINHRKDVYR